MESLFQNCVSEFDLNLFNPESTDHSAPLVKCPTAKKHSIARIKNKLKSVSQLVLKAKEKNDALEEVQKELQEKKTELEETKNLLFEKNEEHKVICSERNVYFNQVTEYSNELQMLKMRLKTFEEKDYDIKLKEKIIEGYSEQVTALQTELALLNEQKRLDKNLSAALKAQKAKEILENKLNRILTDYVCPSIKKPDRWLQNLLRKYPPIKSNISKCDEPDDEPLDDVPLSLSIEADNKDHITKIKQLSTKSLENEVSVLNVGLTPISSPTLKRTASIDIECLESGCGSSLAFSDGEKSFHSPDYYMHDSPLNTVPNLCHKCNKAKTSIATSPLPFETLDIDDSKTSCIVSKTDACTSPEPKQSVDVATDTVDVIFERWTAKLDAVTSPVKQYSDGLPCESNTLRRISICSEDQIIISNCESPYPANDFTASAEDLNVQSSPADKPTVSQAFLNATITGNLSTSNNESDLNAQNNFVSKTEVLSCVDRIDSPCDNARSQNYELYDEPDADRMSVSSNESCPTPVKPMEIITSPPTIEIASHQDTSNEVNLADKTTQELIISTIKVDSNTTRNEESLISEILMTSKVLKVTPDELSEPRNFLQEKQCLELNNSDNFSRDTRNDYEIETILKTVRLKHQILTPIPMTPPRRARHSPTLNETRNPLSSIAEAIDKNLNLVRKDLMDVLSPILNIPEICKQLPELLCSNELNQSIIRNLIHQPPVKEINTITNMRSKNTQSISDCNRESNAPAGLHVTGIKNKMFVDETYTSDCDEDNMIIYEQEIEETHNTNENIEELDSGKDIEITQNTQARTDNLHRESMKGRLSFEVADAPQLIWEVQTPIIRTEFSATKRKSRKLTKLEKIKQKMMPRSKITKEIRPTRKKLGFRPKLIVPTIPKKTPTNADSSASLNNSDIYKNAVKVIAESNKSIISKEQNTGKVISKSNKSIICKEQNIVKLTAESGNELITSNEAKLAIEDCNKIIKIDENKNMHSNMPKINLPRVLNITPCKRKRRTTIATETGEIVHPSTETKRSRNVGKNSPNLQSSDENVNDKLSSPQNKKQKQVDTKTCKRIRRYLSFDDSDSETLNNVRHKVLQSKSKSKVSSHSDVVDSLNEDTIKKTFSESIEENITNNNNLNLPYEDVRKKRISLCGSNNGGANESDKHKMTCSEKITVKNVDPENVISKSVTKKRHSCRNTPEKSSDSANMLDCFNQPLPDKSQQSPKALSDAKSPPQRILRSSIKQNHDSLIHFDSNTKNVSTKTNIDENHSKKDLIVSDKKSSLRSSRLIPSRSNLDIDKNVFDNTPAPNDAIVCYDDIDLFSNEDDCRQDQNKTMKKAASAIHENILCRSIEKHGRQRIKYQTTKVPENKVNETCQTLDTGISRIIELPHELCQEEMNTFVTEIQTWDVKLFLLGLMSYLKDPQRKIELFNKVACPPAPPMTKTEQVLLFILDQLSCYHKYQNIVQKVLMTMEYALFAINKVPEEISVIETMSHFYALVCRNYQKTSYLRAFVIDAMYCLQYKSIVIVKQVLEVCMFILPLAHMGLAKVPLVTCLVYLLHFYKCEDKLNTAQDIRFTLKRKYSYDFSDWNETKIVEIFKTAIAELRDNSLDKKMLRLALLILAKRNGPKWCQNYIVKLILKPMIEDNSTPGVAKRFCVSMLGPLLKPFPNNMKVHCVMMTDYLLDLLKREESQNMKEAIVTSLICLHKENDRVLQFLLKWNPKNISPEFESALRDYVRTKPINTWKSVLSRIDF